MRYFNISFLVLLVLIQPCVQSQEQTEKVIALDTINIYTIGDSTMSNKKNPEVNPEHGWVQVLPQFFNNKVAIHNHAVNGRSTRSFINERRWDTVHHKLKEGDYVFIQFGHNDQKINDATRYTNPYTSYRNNLIKFIEETERKGAIPILFTSIVRRNFNEFGTFVDTHGDYPLMVRLVAQEYNVTLIDLQYLSETLEESYGLEGSKKLHLHFKPSEHSYFPDGKQDDTHLSLLGATEIAKLAVQELGKNAANLSPYIKTEFK
jgi:lysophospholipase L1-like esterase